MNLKSKLVNGYKEALKTVWILVIPVLIDLSGFFVNSNLLKRQYHGINDIFTIKLGVISAPPSVQYILENFPTILYSYNTKYGVSGIITEMNLFNLFISLSVISIISFLKSGYMGCIEKSGRDKVALLDLFVLGNKNWFKYFVLMLIYNIPMFFLFFTDKIPGLLFVMFFVFVAIYYVQYSIVVDDISLRENFSKGTSVLFDNFGLTVKMAIIYGLALSPVSILIFPLSRIGTPGIGISIIIVSILGLGVNKAVIEIYRELSFNHDNTGTESSVHENIPAKNTLQR